MDANMRTVRVYGFLFNSFNQVLIAVERFNGVAMVKFTGGGVKWGEGHSEALIREFKEELNLAIRVEGNIYFNDFAVESVIDSRIQVHSFFYIVKNIEKMNFSTDPTIQIPHEDGERFVWYNIDDLEEGILTFKIEQQAFKALKKSLKNNSLLKLSTRANP